jgi:hypothetical protein
LVKTNPAESYLRGVLFLKGAVMPQLIPTTNERSLLSEAEEFYKAAVLLFDARTHQHLPMADLAGVTSYLIGHSLELLLKAVLFSNGYTEDGLRKIGHDLNRAAALVVELQIGTISEMVDRDQFAISDLNAVYKDKRLEYTITGLIRLPHHDSFLKFLGHLIELAKPIINERFFQRYTCKM